MEIIKNAKMKEYSNMKVGGTARELIFIDDKNELKEILQTRSNIFLLGNGTNTLINDGNLDISFLSLKRLKNITVEKKVRNEEKAGDENKENNSFYVVNQFTFLENENNRRPDIILFINGLPLVLMELKSPTKDEVGAENAYNQIRNYMKDIPTIFYYNAICVISDLSTNKAGTITSGHDRFMEWKTKDGSYEDTSFAGFETFYEGMFQKERLLDILKNFILFSFLTLLSFFPIFFVFYLIH